MKAANTAGRSRDGGDHGGKLPDQDGRHPVLAGCVVAGQQQERAGLGELYVAEGETADLRDLSQFVVHRDRRVEIGHEDAS